MRYVAIAGAVLILTGCMSETGGISAPAVVADMTLPPPAAIADRTTLDEGAALGFETAIAATADLATLAVRTGAVKRAQLPRLRELSADARQAVAAVRWAYDSGNASNYGVAITRATSAIAAVRGLVKGEAR